MQLQGSLIETFDISLTAMDKFSQIFTWVIAYSSDRDRPFQIHRDR